MRTAVMRERAVAALRAVPRTLREDLWTTSADPLPRMGEPGWPVWRPVLGLVVTLGAVFVAVFGVNELTSTYGVDHDLSLLFGLAQGAALGAAMSRPVPAWWAVTAVMAAVAPVAEPQVSSQQVMFPWTLSGIGAQAGVLFLLASRVRPRAAAEALVISVLAGMASVPFTAPGYSSDAGFAVVALAVATVVGAALRGRRVARRQLIVQEEITAEERARRTLLEERNRIARELHDVVAHHMSVISIQAQVAPHLVENPTDELRENLAGIRRHAVEALTELRRVLGVLRSEDPEAEGARHAPQPTLDRLEELVSNVRAAGLSVTTRTEGAPRPLSPGAQLSAFRVVQEALSNAMRHAPGASVRVVVAHHSTELVVRVTNTAPARPVAPSPGAGHGLLGMRERTAMLGGELAAGPTPDGGYEVTATLPRNGLPPDTLPPEALTKGSP